MISIADTTLKVAAAPLNVTAVASVRLFPSMMTFAPALPEAGTVSTNLPNPTCRGEDGTAGPKIAGLTGATAGRRAVKGPVCSLPQPSVRGHPVGRVKAMELSQRARWSHGECRATAKHASAADTARAGRPVIAAIRSENERRCRKAALSGFKIV